MNMDGKDLTKGNLLKNMFMLLVPLIFTNLLNSIYNIVDGIFVGNLIGEDGMAAITNCSPIVSVITALIQGPAIATSVLVAQFFGAKEEEKLKKVCGVSYIITVMLGIISAILMIISSRFLLKILGTPAEIFNIAKQYIIIYAIGNIFNSVLIVIMEALRAIGNSKVPFAFVGISTTINLILDPIFIKMGLGVAGTGLATVIAMFIGMIIAIIYLHRKNSILKIDSKYLKLNTKYIKNFFKIGFPIVMEELFVAVGIALEVNTVNQDGIIAIATYSVVDKLAQAIYIISLSFKTMATVTTGQYIGNKRTDESVKVVKEGIKLAIMPTMLIVLVVFVFPKQFCRIFVNSEEVIAMGVTYLGIIGIPQILSPIKKLVQGFIAGTGHTKILFYSLTAANIAEIVTILVLRNMHIKSLNAIGIGILLWLTVDLAINMVYFFSRRWEKQVI